MDPILYVLRNRAADGLIFSRTEREDPRVRLLLDEGFPFVSHGRTEFSTPHPYVDYDNFAFAHHAAMRLKERGCRKLCIILPPERFTFGGHLRAGFMQAIAETGYKGFVGQEFIPLRDKEKSLAEAIRICDV